MQAEQVLSLSKKPGCGGRQKSLKDAANDKVVVRMGFLSVDRPLNVIFPQSKLLRDREMTHTAGGSATWHISN
jgi:hypothetical protein